MIGTRIFRHAGRAAVRASENSLRAFLMPVSLAGDCTVLQETRLSDDSQAASPLSRRNLFRIELIALHPQRVMPLDLLDRHIPGIGHQSIAGIDGILAVTSSVGSFIDFQINPVFSFVAVKSVIADKMYVRTRAGWKRVPA